MPYSTLCSTFEIHVCHSSNYTQLLGISTYAGQNHHPMLKIAKTFFDALVNGIIFPHFQSVFYAFFNKVNRCNFITCMAPSCVPYLLLSLASSLKPMKKPSSPHTLAPSMSLSTSFSVDILLIQTKRATERMEKGLLGMALKTYKIVLKTK